MTSRVLASESSVVRRCLFKPIIFCRPLLSLVLPTILLLDNTFRSLCLFGTFVVRSFDVCLRLLRKLMKLNKLLIPLPCCVKMGVGIRQPRMASN